MSLTDVEQIFAAAFIASSISIKYATDYILEKKAYGL